MDDFIRRFEFLVEAQKKEARAVETDPLKSDSVVLMESDYPIIPYLPSNRIYDIKAMEFMVLRKSFNSTTKEFFPVCN